MISYGRQTISEKDKDAVYLALGSDFLTTGPAVAEFETKFAEYVGSKYAVAVSSGTAALHCAYMAAGLGKADEIITTPMTFCATANAALYCSARPVFADICPESGLIDPAEIKKNITPKTKIIIPVHYAGQSCDMAEIKKLAGDICIVEDASHALGATYKGKKVGSCEYSDMSIFSFHPVKHITTGEGGMITTNSKELYEKLKILRNHGIVSATRLDEPWYYELRMLGNNYRITDFQCRLGISQLKKADIFLESRRRIAAKYDSDLCVKHLKQQNSAYHLYIILTEGSTERKELYIYLKENNVSCQVHYIPIHYHPLYKNLGFKDGFPVSENFYERILSIPIYPVLKDEEQDNIISLINSFYT